MVIKNDNLEQVKEIYNSSDKKYISSSSNDKAIMDKDMVNYLYYEEGKNFSICYVTVYEKSDFITKEEFDVEINDIKENSIYIWEVGTRKGYEGRGIATKLLKYVISCYPNRDIYSCIDIENVASKRVHEKLGFKPVNSFIGDFFSDEEHYVIVRLEN
jgi:RimJ/RimL family protein N-acetyltransferase